MLLGPLAKEGRLLTAAARRLKRSVLEQECFCLAGMRTLTTVTLIRQPLAGGQVFYSSLPFKFTPYFLANLQFHNMHGITVY